MGRTSEDVALDRHLKDVADRAGRELEFGFALELMEIFRALLLLVGGENLFDGLSCRGGGRRGGGRTGNKRENQNG